MQPGSLSDEQLQALAKEIREDSARSETDWVEWYGQPSQLPRPDPPANTPSTSPTASPTATTPTPSTSQTSTSAHHPLHHHHLTRPLAGFSNDWDCQATRV